MSLNVQLIRASFEQAKPIAQQIVAKFYEHLFTDYPASKNLFAETNMERQKAALLNSLVYVVDHLEDETALHDYLFKMGQRHVGYGAEELHYDWVGASLLKTFAFFFKENWTHELNDQWAIAFDVIKSIMLKGQESVAHAQPVDLRERAKEICSALLLEVLETELDEQVVEAVRTKVREAMHICIEEEAARLLKKAG